MSNNIGKDLNLIKLYERDKKIIMIRAPPGIGKTFHSIKFAIRRASQGDRVGLFFRTREEVEYALSIYWNLVKEMPNAPLALAVVGKDALCRFPPENKKLMRWWCSLIECRFRNKSFPDKFRLVYSQNRSRKIAKLVELSIESGGCPYLNVLNLAKTAPIVISTHNYFISDDLFSKIGPVDIAILDEAHALLIHKSAEIDKNVFEKINRIRVKDLDKAGISSFKSGDRSTALELLEYINFASEDGELVDLRTKLVKVTLPIELFKRRLKTIKKIIMLSATFYPETLYRKIFIPANLDGEFLVIKGISGASRRAIFGLSIGLTTKYLRRDKLMIKKYAHIINVISGITRPILVFTPSYNIAEGIANELGVTVSRDKLSSEGGIVITAVRSRFSEGISVKVEGKEPRIGVMVGIPFPRVSDELKAIADLFAKKYDADPATIINAYVIGDAVSAIIQAMGRIGRGTRGVFIIIDDRVGRLPIRIPIFRDINTLRREVSSFLRE